MALSVCPTLISNKIIFPASGQIVVKSVVDIHALQRMIAMVLLMSDLSSNVTIRPKLSVPSSSSAYPTYLLLLIYSFLSGLLLLVSLLDVLYVCVNCLM